MSFIFWIILGMVIQHNRKRALRLAKLGLAKLKQVFNK
jgi:hypothetical protein